MNCVRKSWRWVQRKLSRQKKPPVNLNNYENALMALLNQLDQGANGETAQSFLLNQGISPQQLAQWMVRFGGRWVRHPNPRLGQQLVQLSTVAEGELAGLSKTLGQAILGERAEPSEPEKYQPLGNQESPTQGDLYVGLLQILHEEYQASVQIGKVVRPFDSSSWLERDEKLLHAGRTEDSIVGSDQALKNKDDHKARTNRGNCVRIFSYEESLAISEQTLEEAIASYDQALKVKPDDHVAWTNRGVALGQLGRTEEEIASYDQVLKVKPDDHVAWTNRGVALGQLGRTEEEIASYDQALKVKPDLHLAWYNRGGAAKASPDYSRQTAQAFRDHFIFEVSAAPQTVLPGLMAIDGVLVAANFRTSWKQSKQLLLSHFADADQLCAHIEQPPSAALDSLIQAPLPDALRAFVLASPASQVTQQLSQDVLLHPARLHPETLNQRGYQGALNSYWAELGETSQDEPKKAICKDTHPEGWGVLHQAIAQTHYDEGCRKPSPASSYWRKAERHFKRALETLKPPDFEDLHLEVLQKLIQVLLDLGEYQEAQVLQQQGRDLIARRLQDPDRSEAEKQKLGLKLGQFAQFTVDLAIQAGDIPGALQQAEFAKNVCLRWLLGLDEAPEVSFPQMQPLLASGAAAVYWHLSPAAITTFLLLPGADAPILIPPAESNDSETDERPPQLQQLFDWESWLKQWNQLYEANFTSKKKTDEADTVHPPTFRDELPKRLKDLSKILNIAAIQAELQSANIDQLLLLPHRDLHRLPLHQLFENYICAYLPTVHLTLSHQPLTPPLQLPSLLLVENPKSSPDIKHQKQKLAPLPFAEMEAGLVRHLFEQASSTTTTLDQTRSTQTELLEVFAQTHHCFHFAGHGAYNYNNPAQSCLFLKDSDRLTLLEIVGLDLTSYQLVSLAACETGMTGEQTITDEYVGLDSAYLKAGARFILSTLWPIESLPSTLLITKFYEQLLIEKHSPAKALKQAQIFLRDKSKTDLIDWLKSYQDKQVEPRLKSFLLPQAIRQLELNTMRHPYQHAYFWSPFILSGR